MGLNQGPANGMTPENARAILRASAASVGRFQAPELFFTQDVSFAAPNTVNIPRPLNLNRPIESMQIKLKFRVAITVANMTSVVPEAPQTMLQQVLLNGTHRQYGNLTPLRVSGSTLFAWQRLFQSTGNDLIINDVRAADQGRPTTSAFLGTTAGSPYDVEITYNIPFGPQMGIGQSSKRDLASYLLQPADWGDTLQLQLSFADQTGLGTPGPATVTFSGFGGTGNPSLSIFLNYSILGPFANSLETGVLVRQEQLFTSFTTAGTALRIAQLQKQITTNLVVKAGTSQSAPTAGVANFATLTDRQLDRTQIVVDNKPIKNNQNNMSQKAYTGRMFNTIQPAGYFLLTFVDGQNPQLAYRGDGLAGGSLFELFSDVSTSGASQIISMVQEMIYGGPFQSLRPL